MRHHIYTLDDYDPEWDCEVITVKVIPGTPEEQLASLEARLASIDRWIERERWLVARHSVARYNALCRRREQVAEHVEFLNAVILVNTTDPEPPTDEELRRWREQDEVQP
jgi:hypothetical protein